MFEYSGSIAEVVASLAWFARFLPKQTRPVQQYPQRVCENVLDSYKTGIIPSINFYRTRIKDSVTITRIRIGSNLKIVLVSG